MWAEFMNVAETQLAAPQSEGTAPAGDAANSVAAGSE